MLDAFIIESTRKKDEQAEWKPTPLTLELPLPDEEETGKEPDGKKRQEITLKF